MKGVHTMAKTLDRKDDDSSNNGTVGPDLTGLLQEPDAPVRVMRHEMLRALGAADKALDGDSNDDEHDALYELRELVSGWLEDPTRRTAAMAKATYYEQFNVGSVRYVVNFADGIQTHRDGSTFYGARQFSNQRAKNAFIRELKRQGYKEGRP